VSGAPQDARGAPGSSGARPVMSSRAAALLCGCAASIKERRAERTTVPGEPGRDPGTHRALGGGTAASTLYSTGGDGHNKQEAGDVDTKHCGKKD